MDINLVISAKTFFRSFQNVKSKNVNVLVNLFRKSMFIAL